MKKIYFLFLLLACNKPEISKPINAVNVINAGNVTDTVQRDIPKRTKKGHEFPK